jgi:hypothetical protein
MNIMLKGFLSESSPKLHCIRTVLGADLSI